MEEAMKLIGMAFIAMVLNISLFSCSDDDDENSISSSQSTNNGIITTDSGEQLLLTSITSSEDGAGILNYDSDGRCIYTNIDDFTCYISYNPYAIKLSDYETLDLSFNNSGYVNRLKYNWSDEYEDMTGTFTFSYDSSGHLTKVSGSWVDIEDGDESVEDVTATLTWSNGNLTKLISTNSYEGNTREGTVTFKYGSTLNKYCQYTQYLAEVLDRVAVDFDGPWLLGFIGYFGKGTASLPTSSETTYTYTSNRYTGSDISYEYEYTLNSDETIKTETMSDGSYNDVYTYGYSVFTH